LRKSWNGEGIGNCVIEFGPRRRAILVNPLTGRAELKLSIAASKVARTCDFQVRGLQKHPDGMAGIVNA
jgi:hypothetical protein